MPTHSAPNPTTPPEPQAGATPDLGAQCPICHGGPLRFSYDSYGTHAYCDSGCHGEILLPCYIEEAKALIRKQAAALATSRAETEKLRATVLERMRSHGDLRIRLARALGNQEYIEDSSLVSAVATLTATLAQQRETGQAEYSRVERELQRASAARDTALARVREAEEDKLMADSLLEASRARVRELEAAIAERVAAKEEYDSNSGVTCLRCGEADKQLKRVLAAARAAGTGEEGGRA